MALLYAVMRTNEDKTKKAKTQRKAECRKRTVAKSLPEISAIFCRWINVASIVIVLQDMSQHYQGYKDLNDYLCNNPQSQSAEPMNRKPQVPSVRRIKQPPKKKRGMGL